MRKVVVVVAPDFLYNEHTNTYAARIRQLGLTAYGNTDDAASDKIKRMFASMVNAHRLKGDIEEWLSSSNLEWHWLDEYNGDIKVEDVQASPPHTEQIVPNTTPQPTHWQQISPMGMAA